MRYMPMNAAYKEWNQPREEGAAVSKDGRAEASKPFGLRHGTIAFRVFPDGFWVSILL